MQIGLYLFVARTWVGFAWKIVVLCTLATAAGLFAETVMGTEISSPLHTYYMVIFIVSAPFFAGAMALTRKLVDLQSELARLAGTDLLTGLANRRRFFQETEWAPLTQGQTGAIILLDVDHFKQINDTYGHDVGDTVLVEVARHLEGAVREDDLVARIGGEEFAVYLPKADPMFVHMIAERLVAGLTTSDDTGVHLKVTLSAGLAWHPPLCTMAELLTLADRALYEAKNAGRACFKESRQAA